ncbi:GNAT family N-acetyltransferase [Allomuricauda sp. F6463D]|uniref:GNAT family N-acetyltransferase n=1 Tax=Allomuricauda sp. F6463D TaxID=2926409 RepID=UPI001FF1F5ED|nr:GNAT family N-acetyltransferase [Muricauda sp. F6463D]MCK0159303.1 GNAT family N-acetyltransferase [Muricauda sp. F6463D]
MITDNPFTSATFTKYWSKHFLNNKDKYSFPFIEKILFYKSSWTGLYINAGKNLTKGVDIKLNDAISSEEKGKTFLIYDVLNNPKNQVKGMGYYSARQYPGYLIELESYQNLDDFLSKTFKKSSRYKLRKYKKRLEDSFNISFKAHCDEIAKEEYDSIFWSFRKLLEKRFEEKQISNNNLNNDEWEFYKDVAYPMILEKKAALFVLYNDDEPISITLSYLSENRVFDAITVFDIDYAKFHLGSIKIMYLVDWCLEHGWNILDFSKGHFDYKTRWSNKKFNFRYYIFFDKKSIKAKFIAYTLKLFFTFKQYLRDKKIHESFHKLTYFLKNKKQKNLHYSFTELNGESSKNLKSIEVESPEFSFLKGICYDFLYLNQEHLKDLKVYKVNDTEHNFLLVGKKNKTGLSIYKAN